MQSRMQQVWDTLHPIAAGLSRWNDPQRGRGPTELNVKGRGWETRGPAKDTVAISKVWRSPKIHEGQNTDKARRETKSSRKQQDKSRGRREHAMSPVNRALTTKNLPRSRVLSSNTQKVTKGEHNRRLPIGWGVQNSHPETCFSAVQIVSISG